MTLSWSPTSARQPSNASRRCAGHPNADSGHRWWARPRGSRVCCKMQPADDSNIQRMPMRLEPVDFRGIMRFVCVNMPLRRVLAPLQLVLHFVCASWEISSTWLSRFIYIFLSICVFKPLIIFRDWCLQWCFWKRRYYFLCQNYIRLMNLILKLQVC